MQLKASMMPFTNYVRDIELVPLLQLIMGCLLFYDWELHFDACFEKHTNELLHISCIPKGWRPSLSVMQDWHFGLKSLFHIPIVHHKKDLDIVMAPPVQGNGPNDQNFIRSFHWLFDKTPIAQEIDRPIILQITAPCKLSSVAVKAFARLLSFTVIGKCKWKRTTGEDSPFWSLVLAVQPEEQQWPEIIQVNVDWVHFSSSLQHQIFQCTAKGFINFASQKILAERTFPLLPSQDVEFAQVHKLSHVITLTEEFKKPFELKTVVGGVHHATMEDPNASRDLMITRAFERLERLHGMWQMDKQRCS